MYCALRTVFDDLCTIYYGRCKLNNLLCTMYYVRFTLQCVPCILHCVQRARCNVLQTPCYVPFIVCYMVSAYVMHALHAMYYCLGIIGYMLGTVWCIRNIIRCYMQSNWPGPPGLGPGRGLDPGPWPGPCLAPGKLSF